MKPFARPHTPPAGSTAELFLAWLAMPELATPVHGPASVRALSKETARPARSRNVRRSGLPTRSLTH